MSFGPTTIAKAMAVALSPEEHDQRDLHIALHALRQHIEDKRADRWHATYNAALTGLNAWSDGRGGYYENEDAHAAATDAANLAHGELVP